MGYNNTSKGNLFYNLTEVNKMLVSAKEMLDKAKAGHYAVGQFNINNLEWTKAVLQTAQELNSPVTWEFPKVLANTCADIRPLLAW